MLSGLSSYANSFPSSSYKIQCWYGWQLPAHTIHLHLFLFYCEQMEPLGMTMKMAIKWSWKISFVFQSLTVQEDEVLLRVIGLIGTVLVCILSVALPALKANAAKKIFKNNKNDSMLLKESETESDGSDDETALGWREHSFNFCYVFVYSCLHILTMMLIMTYNGYVIIMVMVGLTIGYTFFGMELDKDKNLPVNCCA